MQDNIPKETILSPLVQMLVQMSKVKIQLQ